MQNDSNKQLNGGSDSNTQNINQEPISLPGGQTIIQPAIPSPSPIVSLKRRQLTPAQKEKSQIFMLISWFIACMVIISPQLATRQQARQGKHVPFAFAGLLLEFITITLGWAELSRDPKNPKNFSSLAVIGGFLLTLFTFGIFFVIQVLRTFSF
ncbi:MAG: hypothetical protein NVS1B7_0530 [Candidatus Saccharimonadales bacterium]